ncbi:hypothetical protein D3C85_1559160 [compost metagenome]
MACTNASTPLAAVTLRGQVRVICGLTSATSGNRKSLTMPFFSCATLSERIATLVTSEPVPAVVGIAINGGPLRGTWSTPNKSSSAP